MAENYEFPQSCCGLRRLACADAAATGGEAATGMPVALDRNHHGFERRLLFALQVRTSFTRRQANSQGFLDLADVAAFGARAECRCRSAGAGAGGPAYAMDEVLGDLRQVV